MEGPGSETVSELLARWEAGDKAALHAVFPLIYDELRRLARHYLHNERPGHTLQGTALVHEAYVALVEQSPKRFENREHFLAVAAQLLRQILIQHARRHHAAKRDGGLRLTLDEASHMGKNRSVDLLALDDALTELGRLDPQQSQIVEMRFFGGLSIKETARVLDLSPATVKRHWATARVWLHAQMKEGAQK